MRMHQPSLSVREGPALGPQGSMVQLSLFPPSQGQIRACLADARSAPLNYSGVGATSTEHLPPWWTVDSARLHLGQGKSTYQAARQCLQRWAQACCKMCRLPGQPFLLHAHALLP